MTFEDTFAATVSRRGLLPALLGGRPTAQEKHALRKAKRDARRRAMEVEW